MRAQATAAGEPTRSFLSLEVHIALAPDKTYRQRVADDEDVGVGRMLRRPLVVLVVIGTAVPIMAVQRITATVLAASMVSFSFAVAIQLAVGAAVVASAGSRRVSFPRALDLWFAGHVDGVGPAGRADAHPAWRRLSVGLSWLGALGLVVLPTPRTPRTPRTARTIRTIRTP